MLPSFMILVDLPKYCLGEIQFFFISFRIFIADAMEDLKTSWKNFLDEP